MIAVAGTSRRAERYFRHVSRWIWFVWLILLTRPNGSVPRVQHEFQLRFPGPIVAWDKDAAKIEDERRVKANLVPRVKWADALRVAAAQVAGLPVEYEIDFEWIREEMKKAPPTKAKRSKRSESNVTKRRPESSDNPRNG